MGWTTPKTWASLTTLTATDLNTHVRDNLNYLKALTDTIPFSGAQATRSTTQNTSTGVATDLTFTVQSFDYGDWFAPSSTKIIVPGGAIPSGYTRIGILCVGVVRFESSNGVGSRQVKLQKNDSNFGGITMTGINGETQDLTVVDFATAIAGDFFELEVTQTSGGTLGVTYVTLAVVRFGVVS